MMVFLAPFGQQKKTKKTKTKKLANRPSASLYAFIQHTTVSDGVPLRQAEPKQGAFGAVGLARP